MKLMMNIRQETQSVMDDSSSEYGSGNTKYSNHHDTFCFLSLCNLEFFSWGVYSICSLVWDFDGRLLNGLDF